MIFNITEQVNQFLESNLEGHRPLLLGFSGGSDSLALLHVLLTLKETFQLNLHLAHVNHGWRNESDSEAKILQAKAAEWGLPFHCKTLDPKQLNGNLEAASRTERLKFFKEIYLRENCQALILAHHSLDQVETVLKRMFEGNSLPYLSGMAEVKALLGMKVWRPLLKVPKHEIQNYISVFNLQPFEDYTNLDPRYLRARMRTQIIPYLNQNFGKEISAGITRIASEAAELRLFLESHLNPYIQRIQIARHGCFLDLSGDCPQSLMEIKFLLRKMGELKQLSIPHSIIDQAAGSLIAHSADKKAGAKNTFFEIDRGRIFLLTAPFPDLKFSFEESNDKTTTSWKEAWSGKCSVLLPNGNYRLGPPLLKARFLNGPTLGKWWTDNKVPAFLRNLLPVVYSDEIVVHEFLTGRLQAPKTNKGTRISSGPLYEKVEFNTKMAVEAE